MMRVMTVVDSKGTRCFLDGTAAFVQVGIGSAKGMGRFPIIHVSYRPEVLVEIGELLAEMKKQNQNPEVYIWDMEQAEPEVAVVFSLKKPGASAAERIAGRVFRKIPISEIFATGEANIPKASIQMFLDGLAQLGAGVVIVTDSLDTSPEDSNPLFKFLVKKVEHEKPSQITI